MRIKVGDLVYVYPPYRVYIGPFGKKCRWRHKPLLVIDIVNYKDAFKDTDVIILTPEGKKRYPYWYFDKIGA